MAGRHVTFSNEMPTCILLPDDEDCTVERLASDPGRDSLATERDLVDV